MIRIILIVLFLYQTVSILDKNDNHHNCKSVIKNSAIHSVHENNSHQNFWHFLWDSWNYEGDEFNTVKVPNPGNAEGILSQGKNVFVSISHTLKKEDKIATDLEKQRWKTILRGRANQMKNLDTNRTIILLQDEPLGHSGYTLDEVQFMVDWAREYWGEDVQIGFSFVRNSIRKKELPKGIDFALMPMYLFFREDYPDVQIWSKEEFDNYFDEHIKIARKKLPDVDLFIIGQGFYNSDSAPERRRKWRQPPLEAPSWYVEAIERNKLKGLVWWVYDIQRNDVVGLNEMSEYFEEILNINKTR